MAKPSDPTPVTVRQCRMLSGRCFTTPSPQVAVHSTSIAPVASGLGASSTGDLPILSHPLPTHPPSIQTLFLLSKRSLTDSFTLHMECLVLGVTQNQNKSFNSTGRSIARSGSIVQKQISALQQWWRFHQFNSNILQQGQVPFAKLQERLEVTISPLTRQYLSDKDYHKVWTFVVKAEVQVKRRRQPLHLDRVTLEE